MVRENLKNKHEKRREKLSGKVVRERKILNMRTIKDAKDIKDHSS